MKPPQTLTKIEMMERSLRCFTLGLFGLLPVIGIPMAVLAAADYRRVIKGRGNMWNPAHRYLKWGGVFARMGLALFLVVPLVVGLIAYWTF
jgi:hypothetical protein